MSAPLLILICYMAMVLLSVFTNEKLKDMENVLSAHDRLVSTACKKNV